MADETMTEDVFMAHMERAVRRSQEIWPDDWRNHHTFYDGEVARLLDTLRQADEPRLLVRAFALAMERKLAANDGVKGGWRDTGMFTLLDLMRHEISEFQVAMYQFVNAEDRDVAEAELALLRQDVLDEAADVANYLMFACDVIGALPPTGERGR